MAREEEQGGKSPEGEALHRGQEQGWLGKRGEEEWTAHPEAVRVGSSLSVPGPQKTGGFPFPAGSLSGFGAAVAENLPANAGDTGLIPGPGRSHMPRSN